MNKTICLSVTKKCNKFSSQLVLKLNSQLDLLAFEAYKSYYHVGNLDTDNKTIDWVLQAPWWYGHGLELSVAMNNDGTVVEVHRSSSLVHLCYNPLYVLHRWYEMPLSHT